MANKFNAVKAAEVAVQLAKEDAYLSALVSRNLESDILGGGGRGNTVDVRIPGTLTARARDMADKTTEIVLDEIQESTVAVTLGEHIYSAVGLSEQDMNLDIRSFSDQVLQPQVAAVVDRIERDVAKALTDITVDETLSAAYSEADPVKTFTQMRKALRKLGVPQEGLNVVVGTEVYAHLLDKDLITAANLSGSTAALREGNVGKIRGFQIIESTRVDENDIIAFHKDAFTLAVRAPMVPAGQAGHVATDSGFSLRVLQDYDPRFTLHRSMVSTFAGITPMPLYKIERDHDENTSSVVAVTGGAALHLTVA